MKKLLLLPVTLLAFMACDEIINAISSFDASISGAVTANFNGTAEFVNSSVESQTPNSSVLVIDMENKNDPEEKVQLSITLANVTGGVTAGTYTYDVNNTDVIAFAFYYNATDSYIYPDPTATNQIILTKVEGSSIEGTYNYTLTNSVVGGDKITLTGSFKALGFNQTI